MRIVIALGVSWMLLLPLSASAQDLDLGGDAFVSAGRLHRAFFQPGDAALGRLRDAGALRRVESYGSFVLAVFDEVPAGGRQALKTLGFPIRDEQAVIGFNGAPLDTADADGLANALAAIPAFLRSPGLDAAAAEARTLWIVQFAGPVKDAWLERLLATGAVVVSPIASNAYVVAVDPAAVPALAAFQEDPAAQWIGAYHPWFRLAPEVRALDLANPAPVDVTIQLIDGPGAAEVIATLQKARFPERRETEKVLGFLDVRISLPANLIPALAAHPAVFAIEPLPQLVRNDEAQGQIVAGNLNAGLSGPSAPGYLSWLASKGFSSTGQFAFAVDVQDDGIDRGSTTDVNDEFKVLGMSAGTSRVAYANNYTSDPLADSGDGHGNINASIIGGYNALTGAAWQDAGGYHYGLGICPFVNVGATKVFNNVGNGIFFGTNLSRMSAAYGSGARFSSNSWGAISGNGYNADSQSFDTLVRDGSTSAGNQEVAIIFSAGNDGSAGNTVHPPGTAKNVITVGASENNRQTGSDGCGVGNSGANNAMDVISFSSRGPCSDQRKKPDIMAPGTHIEGGASRSLTYDGGGVCNQYWPIGQTLYCWSSGTSHSCPAIAGAGALVRQYFLNQAWTTPSPAMIKAWLMGTTRHMTGVGANDTLWSNSQGMGLVDLGRAFDGVQRVMVDQTQVLGATGQIYTTTGTITSSTSPFRVALVWTDAPGPTVGNAWVNNLDLQVVVNGTTYLGNVFTGAGSVVGGVADTRNNAELVFLPAGTTGSFTVTVTATNIAGDGVPGNADSTDQDFALVIYNGTNCAGVSITSQPANQTVCVGGPASFAVTASGSGLTYQWRKGGVNIAGATASTHAIPAVVAGDAGNYDVVVTSGCSITSSVATLTVPTGVAITTQPSGGASCAGTAKTFTVAATGTAPLTYQWRKNTVNIPGATSASYTIISVQAGDAATYDAVVSNGCGPVTSNGAVLTVNAPVSITTQPSPQAVCLGSPASFTVAANGAAPLTYQWRKNAVNIGGATSATYALAATVAGDAATYSCVVTNGCGSVTSGNAGLTLSSSPAITTQPSSPTACLGGAAAFTVAASGTAPLTYQWRKDLVNIGGATSATYSIPSTVAGDAATYSCVVTNSCGTATSNGGVLTVNMPVSITGQPAPATACQGSGASFTVTATGTAPLSYQWRKNLVNIGGATSPTYVIASAGALDAAMYSCVVTNSCNSAPSNSASLTVNAPVSITGQPAAVTVCEGAGASFTVAATGTAPLSYQWRKDGADIGGATSTTYAIASTAASDAAAYSCAVTNGCGTLASNAVALTVNVPPAIGTQPLASTVCEGSPASFTVTASGTAPLAYQWRKDGANIAGATTPSYLLASTTPADVATYDVVVTNPCGSATSAGAALAVDAAVTIMTGPAGSTLCEGAAASFTVAATGTAPITYQWRKDGSDISGATAATYAIAVVAAADAATYDVVVTGACGSATSAGAVLVVDAPPAITLQPVGATVCEGASAGFTAAATGGAPLAYQWRKDGADISGATAPTYAIASSTLTDAATYDVVVTNACGAATSTGAALAVDASPAVTTPPASVEVCDGAPASFTVAATGAAPLTYQWRKDDADISGATAPTYAIVAVAVSDLGAYDVVVTNGCGSVTSAAAPLTSASIAITTQPSGQTVCAGDAVNLAVTAAGAAPLSYQWQKNGADVPGATGSTFTILAASGSDAGLYAVVITNRCGSTPSVSVPVAVGAPTIATLAPASIAPLGPSSAAVPVAVSGACFVPGSIVYANGVALATTFVDAANLTCLLGPSIPQTQIPGGICFNVQNGVADVSNSTALVVGAGTNVGTIRRHPLAPAPGETYAIVMEGGPPFAIFSLFVDFGVVTPLPGFPDPVTDMVLAVSPATGSAGPFLTVFDGLGVFSAATGIAFDANGTFTIPGIVLPNPPLGAAVTIQAAYLDGTSPIGLRLNWAKFPEEI